MVKKILIDQLVETFKKELFGKNSQENYKKANRALKRASSRTLTIYRTLLNKDYKIRQDISAVVDYLISVQDIKNTIMRETALYHQFKDKMSYYPALLKVELNLKYNSSFFRVSQLQKNIDKYADIVSKAHFLEALKQ